MWRLQPNQLITQRKVTFKFQILAPTDRIKEFYYKSLRKLDFGFMEKGLYLNKETDLLVAGKLEFDKKTNSIVMRRPNLVIGSDRLELYEYFGRKREVYGIYNRNWLKFCVAITALHFVIVEVPTIFSSYFGDEVSEV